MPCQLLVGATTHSKMAKGGIIAARDEPTVWGDRETLPDYIIVRISNATALEVDQYRGRWKTNFQHSTVTQPDLSKRITVTISQKIVDIFGATEGLKAEMKTYLEAEWAATFISYTGVEAVFDVPEGTDLPGLKDTVLDMFERQFGYRWVFDPVEVDIAVGLGGFVDLTKAQAIARIIDRSI